MITPPECSQEIKHKTLSAYYHRVCTLPSWFGVPLVVADDPASYVDFLSGTLCATRDKSCPAIPPLTNGSTDDGRMRSQQECVDWIMHDLAGRGKNVLVKNERVGDPAVWSDGSMAGSKRKKCYRGGPLQRLCCSVKTGESSDLGELAQALQVYLC